MNIASILKKIKPKNVLLADSFRRPDTNAPAIGASDGYRFDGKFLGGDKITPTAANGTQRILNGRFTTVTADGAALSNTTWNLRENDHVGYTIIRLSAGGDAQYFGTNIRRTDANNFYAILVNRAGSIEIFEGTAGVINQRATEAVSLSVGVDYLLISEAIGTLIRGRINGVTVSYTNTTQAGGTNVSLNQTQVGTFAAVTCPWMIWTRPGAKVF